MWLENFQRISQSTQLRLGIFSVYMLRLELRNEFLLPHYTGSGKGRLRSQAERNDQTLP